MVNIGVFLRRPTRVTHSALLHRRYNNIIYVYTAIFLIIRAAARRYLSSRCKYLLYTITCCNIARFPWPYSSAAHCLPQVDSINLWP